MKELTRIEISKLTDDKLRQELELREKKAAEYENDFFNEVNPFSADTEAHHDFELQQIHALQHGIMPHELFEDYDLLVEEAMSRKSFNIYQ